jgi:erythromycin esterase-like protein
MLGIDRRAQAALERRVRPLVTDADLDPVVDRAGGRRVVMLGEATHGTREFYEWRARLSMRLLREKGYRFIAVEGDWPDCFRLNRYVKADARLRAASAREALLPFERWPTWMWANVEVEALLEEMREHNEAFHAARPAGTIGPHKVGFYGLDVYSLHESMRRMIEILDEIRPEAVEAARRAWTCFEPYGEDAQRYALATQVAPADCRPQLAELLAVTRANAMSIPDAATEDRLDAIQNAVTARDAETYYRTMMEGGASSWNVRDRHMMDTLDRLLDAHGPDAKAIVWAHNTHVGDARATDMVEQGELNLGQLARERHGEENVMLVGFGTHHGEVIAARAWDAPMQVMRVPPGARGSLEDVLHGEDKILLLEGAAGPEAPVGHRAIGVVYHPERDWLQYVPTVVSRRYDAFLFVDETRAVRPLRMAADLAETPETYPWGE